MVKWKLSQAKQMDDQKTIIMLKNEYENLLKEGIRFNLPETIIRNKLILTMIQMKIDGYETHKDQLNEIIFLLLLHQLKFY